MSELRPRTVLADMEISGSTRLAGVVGWPVAHSLSPALHNAVFAALGVNAVSVGFAVAEEGLAKAVAGLAAVDAIGTSVTMPHKHAVVALAQERTATVERLGAANCLTFVDGAVHASSTDGQGFLDALVEQVNFAPEGKKVALIGAGGAAAAIAVALADAGADLCVVARRPEAAQSLARLAGGGSRAGDNESISEADLVINATPLGMSATSTAEQCAVDPALLREGQVVFDTVYAPRVTPLLRAADAVGAIGIGGLAMLVHQARHQLCGWTGRDVPVEILWSAVAETS